MASNLFNQQIMKNIAKIFLLLLAVTSCQIAYKEQTITIEDRYTLTLPGFLTKASNLNDDASLQYQNTLREFYTIVIDEDAEEFHDAIYDNNLDELIELNLDGYAQLLISGVENAGIKAAVSETKSDYINGMPARFITARGVVEGIDVFYLFTFTEGANRYYQIVSWTLDKQEAKYKDTMTKIAYSLKEI